MLVYIAVLTLLVAYGVFRWKNRRFYELAWRLGCNPRQLPILGLAHIGFASTSEDIMKEIQLFGLNLFKTNGILSAWLGHLFFVVIGDPVLAEHVSKACLEKDDVMRQCFQPVLGNCSWNGPVSIWRVRRKYLVPPFAPKYLKTFVKVFSEQSRILADKLRPTLGKPVAMFDHAFKYATENLCQTTLGVRLNLQQFAHHPFIDGLEKMSYLTGERFFKPWLHPEFLYKFFPAWKVSEEVIRYNDNFVHEVISIKKAEMQKDKESDEAEKRIKSFLEHIIEAAEQEDGEYSELELKEETLGVTIAGMDTSASAVGFVAAMLARYPRVQEKVYTELTEVFDNDEPAQPEHLSRLNYLDAVIKETLRLYPPVPVITRQADKDTKLPNGVVLPKGTAIIIHLWAINRHPDYWGPDADQFKPERFLDFQPKHPAQFATFSMGPRNCVGFKYAAMSMQTLFATLLRRYRILPASSDRTPSDRAPSDRTPSDRAPSDRTPSDRAPSSDCQNDDLRLTYAISMKDVDNFKVLLQPRQ